MMAAQNANPQQTGGEQGIENAGKQFIKQRIAKPTNGSATMEQPQQM